MAEISVHRVLLLAFSLAKCLEGTKLLAHLKKCGDLECETLLSRALAVRDHMGPDCRFLNFTEGEEIAVYVKLAGEREDLWAGSKGKDFGFFPRDAVQTEEVFISEEIEMSTKESDFLCLLGESYTFGSEDSKFSTDNGENLYPFEEDEDQKYSIYESDFQIESELHAMSESTLFEDQFSASEAPEDTRSASESKDWEEVKAGGMEQNHVPEGDHVLTSLTMSEVQGWFGLGKEQTEEKAFESAIEQGSSFQSRTTAVEDENDLPELNNGEPQTEHRQESESEFGSESPEFDLGSEKQSELALESNHILKSQATGWFDGGFTSYLGFGEEDTGLELLSKESHQPLQDVPSAILSDEEATVPHTEILTEKEDIIINDSSILKPSWFDFGFGMLGFTYANEDKIASDDKKNKEDGGVDKHEHSPASEFDPDKEQEIKMMKIMETEDQTDMVSETELSMRIHEEIYQKTSPSKSNEKSTSLDSEGSAQVEADSSEENILLNSQMVAMDGSLLSENDILQKEDATEFWILKYLFQLDVYDVMNSAFSPILILMERNALFISGISNEGYPALVQQVASDSIYSENSYVTNTKNDNVVQ